MSRTASVYKPDQTIEGVSPQDIQDNCIEARHVGPEEILTAALAADAIDGTKLADDSVDSEHYVDGSIDTAFFAALAVDKAALGADAVDGTKIEDDAIDSEHYVDESIDADHVGLVASNVAIPVVITLAITTGSASEKIFDANAPFKFEILDIIIQPRGNSTNGTMKLTNGTNDITDAMVVATDKTMIKPATIDAAYSQIAASGTLEVVCAGDTIGNTIGLVTIIAQKIS